MNHSIDELRFPIGRFAPLESYTNDEIKTFINDIKKLPKRLKKVLKKWHNKDLDKLYREGGWSARQVIHHLADSHVNAYIRFKLAMTEDNPTIRPYREQLWAELTDSKHGSIAHPLRMLTAVHRRWVNYLDIMEEDDFNRTYFHPDSKKKFTLAEAAALYAWHCNHHLEHVKIALKQGIGKKKVKKLEEVEENDVKAINTSKKEKQQKEEKKSEKKSEKKKVEKAKKTEIEIETAATPVKKENSSIVIVSSKPVRTETVTTNRTLSSGGGSTGNTASKPSPIVKVTTATTPTEKTEKAGKTKAATTTKVAKTTKSTKTIAVEGEVKAKRPYNRKATSTTVLIESSTEPTIVVKKRANTRKAKDGGQ